MPLTPEERKLRASIAAHSRWANTRSVERQRQGAAGQAGLHRRFAAEIEAEHGPLKSAELEAMVQSRLRAYMKQLAWKSRIARKDGVA